MITNLAPEGKYEIFVFAEIGANRGSYSSATFNTVAIKSPPAPTSSVVEQTDDNKVILTFEVPYEDGGAAITSYVYRVLTTDGTLVISGTATVTVEENDDGRLLTSHTSTKTFEFSKTELKKLKKDTIYNFQVAGVNSQGEGDYSASSSLIFKGWKEPVDPDGEGYDGTTAVIIVVVIVVLILVLGAIITYYFCTNQKEAEEAEKDKKVQEERQAAYHVAAPDTERAMTPRQQEKPEITQTPQAAVVMKREATPEKQVDLEMQFDPVQEEEPKETAPEPVQDFRSLIKEELKKQINVRRATATMVTKKKEMASESDIQHESSGES